jgi:hypothetical protein
MPVLHIDGRPRRCTQTSHWIVDVRGFGARPAELRLNDRDLVAGFPGKPYVGVPLRCTPESRMRWFLACTNTMLRRR